MTRPVSHAEISQIMTALLSRADRDGRAHIVGISLSSLLKEYRLEDRHWVLDDVMKTCRIMLTD